MTEPIAEPVPRAQADRLGRDRGLITGIPQRAPVGARALLDQPEADAATAGRRPARDSGVIPRADDPTDADSGTEDAGGTTGDAGQEEPDLAALVSGADEDPWLVAPGVDDPEQGDVVEELFDKTTPPDSERVPRPGADPQQARNEVLEETRRRAQSVKDGFSDAVTGDLRRGRGDDGKPAPRPSAAQTVAAINGRHDYYAQLMVLNCVKPLTNNVGPHELLESATSMAVLWALSPRVRKLVDGYAEKINEALRVNRDDLNRRLGRTPLGSSPAKREAAEQAAKAGDADLLKLTKQCLNSAEGPMPWGVDDAATALLSIDAATYDNIRDGADPAGEIEHHDEVVGLLHDQWRAQGLDSSAIVNRSRELLGEQAALDDSVLARYNESYSVGAHPSARRSDGSWDRRWALLDNRPLDPRSGPFSVRLPLDPHNHALRLTELISEDLRLAAARGGPAAVAELLTGYEHGNQLAGLMADRGQPGSPPPHMAAMGSAARVRLAHLAMAEDGINESLRNQVVHTALNDGFAQFSAKEPAAAAAFAEKYPQGLDPAHSAAFVGYYRGHGDDSLPITSSVPEPHNANMRSWEQAHGVSMPFDGGHRDRRPAAGPGPDAGPQEGFAPRAHPTQRDEPITEAPVVEVVPRQRREQPLDPAALRVPAPSSQGAAIPRRADGPYKGLMSWAGTPAPEARDVLQEAAVRERNKGRAPEKREPESADDPATPEVEGRGEPSAANALRQANRAGRNQQSNEVGTKDEPQF